MKQIIEIMKKLARQIPIVRTITGWIYARLLVINFSGSQKYWSERYRKGGNSGTGSYKKLAKFKAAILNDFVEKQNIRSVIEYGCGDGNQLRLAIYPRYLGFDVSPVALTLCKEIFHDDKIKIFKLMDDYDGETAELTLSLDVVYHLVEDEVFELYMTRLFDSSTRFVIVYSSNKDEQDKIQAPHVKHRKFTQWVDEHIRGWRLIQCIPNSYQYTYSNNEGSLADFYIYAKAETSKRL